jgi:hypothetical protein
MLRNNYNPNCENLMSQYLSRLRHLTSWFSLAALHVRKRSKRCNTESRRSPRLNFPVLGLVRRIQSLVSVYQPNCVGAVLLLWCLLPVLSTSMFCSDLTVLCEVHSSPCTIFPSPMLVWYIPSILFDLNMCSLDWQINFDIHIKK